MEDKSYLTKSDCIAVNLEDGVHYYDPETEEEVVNFFEPFDEEEADEDYDDRLENEEDEGERSAKETEKEGGENQAEPEPEPSEPMEPGEEAGDLAGDAMAGDAPAAAGADAAGAAGGADGVGAAGAPGLAAAGPEAGGELLGEAAAPFLPEIAIGCLIALAVILVIAGIIFLFFMIKPDTAGGDECNDNGSTTIVLDPGHPSEVGSGAEGGGIKEVEKVAEVANAIKPKLETKGYKVILTRSDNTTVVTNQKRAEIANNAKAALMFRIHNDSRGGKSGFAYYYPAKQGTKDGKTGPSQEVMNQSKNAATRLLDSTQKTLADSGLPAYNGGLLTDAETAEGKKNGGALAGSIYSEVPVALIELGDLDSSKDTNWLKSKANIDKYADSVANGVAAFAPPASGSQKKASSITFPVKGTKQSYTGRTKGLSSAESNRAPSNPMPMAPESKWFYQWPIPDDKGNASNTGEPAFGACRGTGCNRKHQGVDIYGYYGTPIVAPEDGTITEMGGSQVDAPREPDSGGAGRWLLLDGASGYDYKFMHTMGFSDKVIQGAGLSNQIGNISSKSVKVPVKAGDIIAYIGNTGGIQNPHLHFAVLKNGNYVDPKPILESGSASNSTTCGTSSEVGQKVVDKAKTMLGTAYVWGGCHGDPPDQGCTNFDCSGLVGWAWYWGSDKKVNLHGAATDGLCALRTNSNFKEIADIKEAIPGDILVWDYSNGCSGNIHHTALYMGNMKYIHAPSTGDVVKISTYPRADGQKALILRPIVK